jgi:hypothetical protein
VAAPQSKKEKRMGLTARAGEDHGCGAVELAREKESCGPLAREATDEGDGIRMGKYDHGKGTAVERGESAQPAGAYPGLQLNNTNVHTDHLHFIITLSFWHRSLFKFIFLSASR